MYRTLRPCSWRYSVRSSAIRFVSVVTSVRKPFSAADLASSSRSSTWCATGRTSTAGSTRPVGRMTCSAKTPSVCPSSQSPGVADTNTDCGRMPFHSSNLSGRLSTQDGSLNPCSARVCFRRESPLYIAPSWGTVTCDSSAKTIAWSGMYSNSVGGGSPGRRPVRNRE